MTPLSTLITLNKPFPLTMSQLFTWQFQRLKPFTGRGLHALIAQNTHRLPLLFVWHVRKLMSIMKRLQCLQHMSCQ